VYTNNIGIAQGDRIELSATVTPNGAEGTTGTAQTTNLLSGALTSPTPIPFVPLTVNLNYFNLNFPYNQYLTGPSTVTFTINATTPPTATAPTNSIEGVAAAPRPSTLRYRDLASILQTAGLTRLVWMACR
jgi:hypothetical protein